MALPAPDLDDRRFQDLVDDAKRMVMRRCPEWTDHNVSDPGVTLIETFAFLTDQVLFRLNRVPDRLYLKFLDLIGLRLVYSSQVDQARAEAAVAGMEAYLQQGDLPADNSDLGEFLALLGGPGGHFLLHDAFGLGYCTGALTEAILHAGLKVVQVEYAHARHLAHVRGDVTRHADVNNDQRPTLAFAQGRLHHGCIDDGLCGAGAHHDQVG